MNGVVAQLVERLICIQEAWGSIPHNSIFFYQIELIIRINFIKIIIIFSFCSSSLEPIVLIRLSYSKPC